MSKRFHTNTHVHVQKLRSGGSGEGAQVCFLQTNVRAQTLFGVSTVLDHITGRRRCRCTRALPAKKQELREFLRKKLALCNMQKLHTTLLQHASVSRCD